MILNNFRFVANFFSISGGGWNLKRSSSDFGCQGPSYPQTHRDQSDPQFDYDHPTRESHSADLTATCPKRNHMIEVTNPFHDIIARLGCHLQLHSGNRLYKNLALQPLSPTEILFLNLKQLGSSPVLRSAELTTFRKLPTSASIPEFPPFYLVARRYAGDPTVRGLNEPAGTFF